MEILVATHNEHKKAEIQQILPDYRITSLSDYQLFDEIIENGQTFQENAKIKAQYCFQKTGKPSLGDDSGLVVPALGGRPGIYSARYAGDHDFKANIKKVLEEMQGNAERSAYFITVLCLISEDQERYFEGRVYGKLAHEVSGEKGFGYDPIFIPEHHNLTFAEMKTTEKNKISHRAHALRQFLEYLKA
ncbi:RdgB/HAM1 family non-canonical purine NTP pyrophosphatase [Elizabethkingia argentiflava]|uniref:dITP/XTP pyrophosphatase n=1 Tax=Elizabethkingia argenteiflava TaxID=2681556 RepID=A0A845PYC4_9FLAO|nr:RdgB/HAM1 family non-canonical purine NTP pyrophosphatase [Elizabethkingia argenteiflava]NAW51080.1 RdgB/HAM1 family non-canonical purine NTP pyrophosphatase [Elizabethkingia argenteiflava]